MLRSEVFTRFQTAKFYNKNETMPERLAMHENNTLQSFCLRESSNDDIIDFFSSLNIYKFVEQEIFFQEKANRKLFLENISKTECEYPQPSGATECVDIDGGDPVTNEN